MLVITIIIVSELQCIYGKQPVKEAKQETPFYRTKAWRQVRYEVLVWQKRKSGLPFNYCEICNSTTFDIDESGKPLVMTVDHIKPRSKYPELALEKTNLRVTCWPCNYGKGTLEIE